MERSKADGADFNITNFQQGLWYMTIEVGLFQRGVPSLASLFLVLSGILDYSVQEQERVGSLPCIGGMSVVIRLYFIGSTLSESRYAASELLPARLTLVAFFCNMASRDCIQQRGFRDMSFRDSVTTVSLPITISVSDTGFLNIINPHLMENIACGPNGQHHRSPVLNRSLASNATLPSCAWPTQKFRRNRKL
jgi:hypothetical protein